VGCHGVTVAGVLGESNRLTDFEKKLLIQTAVNEVRQTNSASQQEQQHLPFQLCVGVTHTGTAATVALCEMAVEIGVDAVMVSPTKPDGGAQPSDSDIYYLFEQIATACPNTSIVLQDLPSSSGVYLSIEVLVRILSNIPQVTTVKLESLPTVSRLSALRTSLKLLDVEYSVLTGLGALYSGFDLLVQSPSASTPSDSGRVGSDGFMTGFAFPEVLLAMNRYAQMKEYGKVRQLYEKYLPLIVLEQQPVEGLAIRKELYRQRGLIESSHVRHPGKKLSITLKRVVQEQLELSFPSDQVDIKDGIHESLL